MNGKDPSAGSGPFDSNAPKRRMEGLAAGCSLLFIDVHVPLNNQWIDIINIFGSCQTYYAEHF
jgi:hypothetical protein